MKKFLLLAAVLSTLSINSAQALPLDWSGVFGADTHYINNFRRTGDTVTKTPGPNNGTEGIDSRGGNTMNFQTYIFRLSPQIIVNDGVTFKSEISTGEIRGGFLGDNSQNNADSSGNNSYYFNSPANRSGLNVNQAYMELYADTALVKIGRMSKHYGLGAVFNDGKKAWDRFFTLYDGIEGTMRIGNFSVTPYWAKISSNGNNSAATNTAYANNGATVNKSADVREMGITAQYDNKNRDLVVSVLYAKRFAESGNTLYNASNNGTAPAPSTARGKSDVTIIDAYASKKWNKFKIAAEIPIIAGDYGNVYDANTKSKIAATAYIVEASYELNPKWSLALNAGQLSGDKGSTNKFEGMHLQPNYQIADLMFRYYYPAVNEGGKSIFDSSMNNARYVKLGTNYMTDKWTWKFAGTMAKAMETAEGNGTRAYQHEENYSFTSNQKQSDDLGMEFDLGFDYRWNPNVTISGYYGYWLVGDYYEYTNTTNTLSVQNVHGGGLRATLEF